MTSHKSASATWKDTEDESWSIFFEHSQRVCDARPGQCPQRLTLAFSLASHVLGFEVPKLEWDMHC